MSGKPSQAGVCRLRAQPKLPDAPPAGSARLKRYCILVAARCERGFGAATPTVVPPAHTP